ncbi:SDR family oxidoreductase [Streptomyces sp. NPDC026672]|uniref:SDR family oxidoreductase n=1 Tax=unclassified Streptomyces TaxID=2593676 RepID=UPI0033DFF114
MTDTRFAGKTVVITGGGSGIGLATARRVAAEGGEVTIIGSTRARLDGAVEALRAEIPGSSIHTAVVDVADEYAFAAAIHATHERAGRLDALFNNAGYEGPLVRLHEYTTEDFRRVVNVNLMGTFYGMKHALPIMAGQGGGVIVNNSSVGGIRGFATRSAYSATKHGIIGLSRTAGAEYGKDGVSVIAIAPGAFTTPMSDASIRSVAGADSDKFKAAAAAGNPMRRFGEVDEAAALVAFLMSGEAPYINGTVITIDGGQTEAFG